ncbi:MAG: outer membrane protein assembly factor BamA [Candidatus Acidiferrales bacterium]|jgi:outer membrane protein insertion porin family
MSRRAAASGSLFLHVFLYFLAVCALGAAGAPSLCAQGSPQEQKFTIQRIEFVGNRRIARDTLMARIFSRQGDVYSDEAVRRDFLALWNTQFFEDVRVEVEDSPNDPNAKIIVFYVQERPIIRRIEYKGNKSISESDILDAFKDKKVGLTVESQFDPTKIKKAETVIKQLLAEHGRQFAVVRPTFERIAATNAVKLVFNIDEGPKVKVGKIIIEGNKSFSARRIIRAMRHSRPISVPLYFTDFDIWSKTFDQNKLEEDEEVGIRGLYQNHGFFRVIVHEAVLNTVEEDRSGLPLPIPGVGRAHGKRTDITIKIEEGDRYRMGNLTVRSADPDQGLFFKPEFLEKVFPLKKGDIFDADKLRKAFDNYKKLYGEFGYIDFTSEPQFEPDDAKKTIDVTMVFDQQKQFFVRRIDFSGNTTTRDKVIRREILLDEGQLFNNRLWEVSILRLNQLGYFEVIKPENAELKRNIKAGTVDINLKVKEKGKQSISLNGGVSGLAGSFIGLSYQTNNFLGLGETLTFSAAVGDRQRNLVFGFTEPYLFDRPISTGFTVFSQRFDYNQQRETSLLVGQQVTVNPAIEQNYNTDTKGFTLFASYPIRRFSFTRLGVTYGYTTTNITAISQSSQLLFESLQFQSLAGPSALNGIHQSKVTPTLSYSTVNSQLNPTGGKSFFYGLGFEGGPLGGNTNTITNTFTTTYFHHINKRRNVIGMRFLAAVGTGFGGKVEPPQNRFYLGGENDIRGFDFFTVSPYVFIPTANSTAVAFLNPTRLNQNGSPTLEVVSIPVLNYVATRPGGDTQAVGNFEYRIPIAGPVSMSLFTDLGIDGILRRDQLALAPSSLNLLQQEFPNSYFPNTNVAPQLPLAPGTNWRPRASSGIEFVVQLPIVNAPFRFYYAYNPLTLDQTVVSPRGAFFISDDLLRSLPGGTSPTGVLATQIIPQLDNILDHDVQRLPTSLLEPHHTFRFTVSRTF